MPTDAMATVIALMEDLMADWMPAAYPEPDLPRLRELMHRSTSLGKVPPSVRVLPAEVNGIEAEWLIGSESEPDRRLLYVHGGSYLFGDIVAYRALAAQIAQASRASVLTINYRLAPEHPFHAPRDDTVCAFEWMRDHGPTGPGLATLALIAGDSAGGGAALAATQALLDSARAIPDGLVLLSPAVDLSNHDGFPPQAHPMVELHTRLFLGGADASDPIASPIHGRLSDLPPMLIQVSTAEPAMLNVRRFVERAEAAGCAVQLETWPAMPHVWHMFAPALPEGTAAIDQIGDYVRGFNS